jgi:hypothetical protein
MSLDEITDVEGQYIANVIIGTLEEDTAGPIFLLNTKSLKKINHSTVNKLFDKSLNILWHNGIRHDDVADPVPTYSKLPPSIFIRGVEDFPGVCTELIELIGVNNFICKSTVDLLKIRSSNPGANRTLVHYLRNEQAKCTHLLQRK